MKNREREREEVGRLMDTEMRVGTGKRNRAGDKMQTDAMLNVWGRKKQKIHLLFFFTNEINARLTD